MIIKNVVPVLKDKVAEPGWIEIQNGKIKAINKGGYNGNDVNVFDANGLYAMPGFVDTHSHGHGGYDFMDGTVEDVIGAARAHARYGTTTVLPTSLTSSDEDLFLFLDNVNKAKDLKENGCAKMPGVHLEGPYFDMVQKGAQDPRYIRTPEKSHYSKIMERADGLIKRWSVAPELDGAPEMIKTLSKQGVLISGGHTDATYDVVSEAFDNGLSLLTHFYSGMSSISRRGGFRVLGTVEAGYLIDNLNIELICDAKHLPPELLRLIFKFKDHSKIIACTDSMRGAGMPDGPSILGPIHNGTDCIIEDGIAKMPDRSCFAGSVCTGNRLAKTLHNIMGFDLPETSRITSLQSAKLIGMDNSIGSLEVGKQADIVICTETIDVKKVFIDGVAV